MGILEGKVAIVTGGGQGLGEGAVYALCHEGATVANFGRTYEKVARVADAVNGGGGRAMAFQCDVTDRASVDAAVAATVKEYGKIDILVNNAMTQRLVAFEEATAEDLMDAYKSSVLGTFNCMKACFPYLKKDGGKVINFGSGAGVSGVYGMSTYGAAKEAVRGLSKCLATEWGKYNINVNVVVPSGNSPAWEKTKEHFGLDAAEKMLEGFLIKRPNLSLGDPMKDIGGVIVFLASSYSDYMTGRTLFADGGNAMFR